MNLLLSRFWVELFDPHDSFSQDLKCNVGNALSMMLDGYECLPKRFSGKGAL